jgi:hypothetical protein
MKSQSQTPVVVHCIKRSSSGSSEILNSITDNGIILQSVGQDPETMKSPTWVGEHAKLHVVYTKLYDSLESCINITNTYWEYCIILDAKKLCATNPDISVYELNYQFVEDEHGPLSSNSRVAEKLLSDVIKAPIENGATLGFKEAIKFTNELIVVFVVPRTPPPDLLYSQFTDIIYTLEHEFFYAKHYENLSTLIMLSIPAYEALRSSIKSVVSKILVNNDGNQTIEIINKRTSILKDVSERLSAGLEDGKVALSKLTRMVNDPNSEYLNGVIDYMVMFRKGFNSSTNRENLRNSCINNMKVVKFIIEDLTSYLNTFKIATYGF